jgi:hypothetical protein
MQWRMKEPYRKAVATRLVLSLAEAVARLLAKLRLMYQWARHGAAKTADRDADLLPADKQTDWWYAVPHVRIAKGLPTP